MYKGMAFSPQTKITAAIGAADTNIPVESASLLPDAPNVAVIGTDIEGETIIYSGKTSSALTGCIRGAEGAAKAWEADTAVARNFTNLDYQALINNICDLQAFIGYTDPDVYGIEADFQNNKFTRLAGAAGGTAGAGFDGINAFGGRKRCVIAPKGLLC